MRRANLALFLASGLVLGGTALAPPASAVSTGHGGGFPDPLATTPSGTGADNGYNNGAAPTTPTAPAMSGYSGYNGAPTPSADMGAYNGYSAHTNPSRAPVPGQPLGASRTVAPRTGDDPSCYSVNYEAASDMPDCDTEAAPTTVTIPVAELAPGALFITVPGTATTTGDETVTAGDEATVPLGTVTVTDDRTTGAGTQWAAYAAATNFTGDGPDITAAEITYHPNVEGEAGATETAPEVTLGPAATAPPQELPTPPTGNGSPFHEVVTGTTGADWSPEITMTIPGTAGTGTYGGTIYHAVL
jgi:hypothetical protein